MFRAWRSNNYNNMIIILYNMCVCVCVCVCVRVYVRVDTEA